MPSTARAGIERPPPSQPREARALESAREPERKLDTASTIETPEGVEIALLVAGPFPRALAWTIDVATISTAYITAAGALTVLGSPGRGAIALLLFALNWAYDLAFELTTGATVGKRLLGLRVVRADGTAVGWSESLIRNLLRAVDILPIGYCIGLCSCIASRDFQRLGDRVAGTLVVYAPARARKRTPESASSGAAQAPPIALSVEEQAAVIEFAERAPRWSPERRAEIAGRLAPLLGAEGAAAVERVEAMARWIRG